MLRLILSDLIQRNKFITNIMNQLFVKVLKVPER